MPGFFLCVLAALFLSVATAASATAPLPSLEGRTPDERAAAFLAYGTSARPRREDFPKEAMAYYLARLKYTSLQGCRQEIVFRPFGKPDGDRHKLDGKPVDSRSFPRLETPGILQAVDGDVRTVTPGGRVRTWDSKDGSTTEAVR